ncbi:unnamed protein product, partial [Iphiclides podalirius]
MLPPRLPPHPVRNSAATFSPPSSRLKCERKETAVDVVGVIAAVVDTAGNDEGIVAFGDVKAVTEEVVLGFDINDD